MSKVPMVPQPLGSPKDSFDNILSAIISTDPSQREVIIKPHLLSFIAHPVIKELLSQSKTPAPAESKPPQNLELKQIQDTLSLLSKAVERLSKGNSSSKSPATSSRQKQKKGENAKQPQRTYSAVAGSRPPNPSLVVDLAHLCLPGESRPRPELICETLNKKLGEVSPPQVQLAAARWTAKGNLIITAGPSSTPVSLLSAAPHINAILSTTLQLSSHSPFTQPRANTKWSKITINGVPTGASHTRTPYTPEECHAALAAINPTYATLQITQKPSWVRPPSSYPHGSASSLSVTFEDPDGAKMKALLTERYLYAFGNRSTVKKWKYRPTKPKDNSNNNAVEHDHDSVSINDEEDVESSLQAFVLDNPFTAATVQPRIRSNRPITPLFPLET